MRNQTQEDTSALVINIDRKIQESHKQAKIKNGEHVEMITPQFPYTKWEIIFLYLFYLVAFLYILNEFHQYTIQNFDQIRPLLKRSYLSNFLLRTINPLNNLKAHNNQDLQLLQFSNGFQLNIYRYNKDSQWEAYRSNLWLLVLTALAWKFLTYLFYLCDKFILGRSNNAEQQNQIFSFTNDYIFVFSFLIMLFSFRADIIFYLLIIISWWLYFQLLIKLRSKIITKMILKDLGIKRFNNLAIISFWFIMLVTLYLNQITNHFSLVSTQFQKLIPEFLSPLRNSYRAIHCSQFLNMTFLRLLSYGIDRIHEDDKKWEQRQINLKHKRMVQCEECKIEKGIVFFCYKGRDHVIKRSHTLRQYLNYTLFTPLLLTGPPISYNSFYSYEILPAPKVTFKQLLYHIFLVFSFQVYQHLIPVITLTDKMTLLQMEIFSLFHLVFIWFKFLIIWKTAKIWASLYGVHVIDNMSRCIFNNYGFEGFWRMWHRGFNQWLIRYLYIPLGGKDNILSVLGVVIFVAFWHDHTINIIFWGLIIALFMVPEILIKRYFRKHKKHLYTKYWFKYIAGFVSSIYIHFLVICNCIGFGYGMGKMELVFDKIITEYTTIIWSVSVVTVPTLCMFHKRNLQNNTKNY